MASKQRRIEGTTVACPFVYGSIAHWMGKKAGEFATHKWTLYIRGPNMEDMSSFISKVVFTLHPSFAAPIREISEPPYQVSEFGWGEFEAGIRIFFRDADEQPIDLIHQIKLYPQAPEGVDPLSATAPPPQNSKKPVVSEQYDEAVFTDPTESFRRLLMLYSVCQTDLRGADSVAMEHYLKFDDTADLEHLAFIQDYISRETDAAKMRLLQLDAEMNQMLSDTQKNTKALVPGQTPATSALASSFAPPLVTDLQASPSLKGAQVPLVDKTTAKSTRAGPALKAAIKASLVVQPVTGPSNSVTWNLKPIVSTTSSPPTDSNGTSSSNANLSKKAQASAAAAAALKQMEQLSSVRMS